MPIKERYIKMAKVKPTKKDKKFNLAGLIAAILVVVILIGLVFVILDRCGVFLRVQEGASSDNFEINASMMEYYSKSYVNNWYSQNYYYILLGYIKFDPTQPYNQQYTDATKTQTYYDYFVEGTKTSVSTYLKYCEAARVDSKVDYAKLESDAEKYADETIASLKESAQKYSQEHYKEYGTTVSFEEYIRQNFGSNVNKDDLKKAIIIEHIASDYYQLVHDRIHDGITTEREDKYFEDNISSFVSAEYMIYTLSSLKTVNWPNAEDYVGGAESAAYKKAVEGKTAQQILDAKIDPAHYEGGEESEAYKKAYKTAEDNKKANEDTIARDREVIEKLANCKTADEFKTIILEEKYDLILANIVADAIIMLSKDKALRKGEKFF